MIAAIVASACLATSCGCVRVVRGPTLGAIRETTSWQEYSLYRAHQAIRAGMSKARVLEMVGSPDFEEAQTCIWRCQQDNRIVDLTIVFRSGEVSKSSISEMIAN